jgi:hypothetical protein
VQCCRQERPTADDAIDELGEFLSRVIQSIVITPKDPPRPAPNFRVT